MNGTFRRRLAAGATIAIVGVLTVTTSCSPDAGPRLTGPARSGERASISTLPAAQRERLRDAKARTRSVGRAHHVAMQLLIREAAERKKAKRRPPRAGTRDYCRLLERAGDTALAIMDEASGTIRSPFERRARIRSEPGMTKCSGGLTVFGFPYLPGARRRVAQSNDAEVTGAYEVYVDPLQAAVDQSDGSTASTRANVDAVLVQAISEGIPQTDLEALAYFAGLIESSAAEWTSYDGTSGESSCTSLDGCWEMSVFRYWDDSSPWSIFGADVAGCLSSVKSWRAVKALLYRAVPAALGAECGVRATMASGLAFMAEF